MPPSWIQSYFPVQFFIKILTHHLLPGHIPVHFLILLVPFFLLSSIDNKPPFLPLCGPCTIDARQFHPLRNNNFQLTDNAARFVAGSSEKSKAYLRTFDVSGRLFQLALSESGLLFSGYNGDYGSSGKTLWEGVTKSDLTDSLNHKKQILPWSTYRDGNYPISNFKFGSNLYIAVGASSKVQKRCSIMAANDSIQIPHPEGFITIVFNDTNHITVSGTTNNYQLREIRASDLFGI